MVGDPGGDWCPASMIHEPGTEPHPHHAGLRYVSGRRTCAVCGAAIPDDHDGTAAAVLRGEARAVLSRLAGYDYWRPGAQTPSAPAQDPGGATPPRGPRPEGRKERETP